MCYFFPGKRVHSAKILSILVATQSVWRIGAHQQILVLFILNSQICQGHPMWKYFWCRIIHHSYLLSNYTGKFYKGGERLLKLKLFVTN